jgi:hypothetical protein
MDLKDLASRVLQAVSGNNEAIKKLSEALVSRDPARIKKDFSEIANVQLTDEEVSGMLDELPSDPTRVVAYQS